MGAVRSGFWLILVSPAHRAHMPVKIWVPPNALPNAGGRVLFQARWNFFRPPGLGILADWKTDSGGMIVSLSQAVAQHLPYLRRYARALTGNQTSGDAYVKTTLEALIEDPSVLDQGASTRVALYRLFTKIWNSVPLNGSAEANADEMPIE